MRVGQDGGEGGGRVPVPHVGGQTHGLLQHGGHARVAVHHHRVVRQQAQEVGQLVPGVEIHDFPDGVVENVQRGVPLDISDVTLQCAQNILD